MACRDWVFKPFGHNKIGDSAFQIFNAMSPSVSFWGHSRGSGEDCQFMSCRHKEFQGQENCPYEMPYYARALLMMQGSVLKRRRFGTFVFVDWNQTCARKSCCFTGIEPKHFSLGSFLQWRAGFRWQAFQETSLKSKAVLKTTSEVKRTA